MDQWCSCQIPFGKDIPQKYIYDNINELLDFTFDPQMFTVEGEAAQFYVQLSGDGADALKSLTKRIVLQNGRKVYIQIALPLYHML